MKLLLFWDVYGRIWRAWLKKELPNLIKKYNPDFVLANVDNVSSARWAIEKHLVELEKIGIDIFTGWDHIFDNFLKIKDYLSKPDSKLLRFANMYDDDLVWEWFRIFEKNGQRILVIHVQWEQFMPHKVSNPFKAVEKILSQVDPETYDGVILDFHKETTAEWYGMAHYLDWKLSFVFGTHTHIQTNDEMILKWWTWIISDLGMNWPINSVIWASFESVKDRFLTWINRWKIEQSLDWEYIVNWVYLEIWKDKLCSKIEKIKIRWI